MTALLNNSAIFILMFSILNAIYLVFLQLYTPRALNKVSATIQLVMYITIIWYILSEHSHIAIQPVVIAIQMLSVISVMNSEFYRHGFAKSKKSAMEMVAITQCLEVDMRFKDRILTKFFKDNHRINVINVRAKIVSTVVECAGVIIFIASLVFLIGGAIAGYN